MDRRAAPRGAGAACPRPRATARRPSTCPPASTACSAPRGATPSRAGCPRRSSTSPPEQAGRSGSRPTRRATAAPRPWSSKGFREGHAHMARASRRVRCGAGRDGGALPVVIDANSCAHGIAAEVPDALDDERRERLAERTGARRGHVGARPPAAERSRCDARRRRPRCIRRAPRATSGSRGRWRRCALRSRTTSSSRRRHLLRHGGRPRPAAPRADRGRDRGRGDRGDGRAPSTPTCRPTARARSRSSRRPAGPTCRSSSCSRKRRAPNKTGAERAGLVDEQVGDQLGVRAAVRVGGSGR